ncbi:T-cell receptor gamma alternate reading frame protein isoform X3 [Tamandua tetradactyla]|uniref:T-cell receptor gamma alternate reading frame protein isoform X3 n=1 Tax=Tamandua tetradactyla TaxID=48850 RepID=UPI004053F4BC
MFLPSIAERHLHKAGTYLCLLENFFPDVIKIYWKEKDGDKILDSYQGDTVQTQDTYMTFSLLTVSGKSMDKEHKCMVKHEKNKGGVDQEILFPPINKGVILKETTEASVKGGSGVIPTVFMEPSLKNQNGDRPFPSSWCSTAGLNAVETNQTTSLRCPEAAAHKHLCILHLPSPPCQEHSLLCHHYVLPEENGGLWS